MQKYAQMGQFWAVLVRMADLWDGSDRKTLFNVANRARWEYNVVVFEVKKEIPIRDDNILSWLFLVGRFWLRYWLRYWVRWLSPSP